VLQARRVVCWSIGHRAHATRALVWCQRRFPPGIAGMRKRRSWVKCGGRTRQRPGSHSHRVWCVNAYNVEMVTPTTLLYQVLVPSLSTCETPPRDAQRVKHGQNISYMDAEIIGSYFEEMLQTSRPLVWPPWSVSPRHLCQFLAQNKIRLFPHWRNACLGHVCNG
jgi:hypothetical protein